MPSSSIHQRRGVMLAVLLFWILPFAAIPVPAAPVASAPSCGELVNAGACLSPCLYGPRGLRSL